MADWLSLYLEYTRHSESPEQFHYWTGVSVIASALRRKCWLDMGYFKWSPNFFIFLVAPPAIVSKSTSVNIGTRLLAEVDGVKFGPTSVTWQAILQSFSDASETYPLSDDPMGNYLDMACITVNASELGTFLDPHNREMIDLMNDMWDGKDIPFVRRTKMDGEQRINNPWINMIACTTPAWIADNVNNQFAAGGFASRTIFVFAEVKRHLIAYPFLSIPESQDDIQSMLVTRLREIALLRGEFRLTNSAIEWGTHWYAQHYEKYAVTNDNRYRGHIDRKQTHLHKLAMVISAAEGNTMRITADQLAKANDRLTALEKDIPRVFSAMNKEEMAHLSSEVLGHLMDNPEPIMRQELFRKHFMNKLGYETYTKVVDSCINSGLVDQVVRGANIYLQLNTTLLTATATRLRKDGI